MKRLKKMCCVFLYALYALLPALSQESVTLTSAQITEIRNELDVMKRQVHMLKNLQIAQEANSSELEKKCTLLENALTEALQSLEKSEQSVIQSQKTVQTLKEQLEELRKEYRALAKSSAMRKKLVRGLTVTIAIVAGIAITEGVIILAQR
jgi:hypothetical protein|nr:MAG TPA: SECRETED 45 KDA PROTEIN CYCLE, PEPTIDOGLYCAN, CHAP, CELL [Caudoviricetes sp.]